jgi:hypothetical protein
MEDAKSPRVADGDDAGRAVAAWAEDARRARRESCAAHEREWSVEWVDRKGWKTTSLPAGREEEEIGHAAAGEEHVLEGFWAR